MCVDEIIFRFHHSFMRVPAFEVRMRMRNVGRMELWSRKWRSASICQWISAGNHRHSIVWPIWWVPPIHLPKTISSRVFFLPRHKSGAVCRHAKCARGDNIGYPTEWKWISVRCLCLARSTINFNLRLNCVRQKAPEIKTPVSRVIFTFWLCHCQRAMCSTWKKKK